MSEEPPHWFWTKESIDFLATRLCLPNESFMQDWPYEVADPAELEQYLSLFSEVKGNDDVRFTLADVIIQAFEELERELDRDFRWKQFLDRLAENLDVHAYQIWYWSALDTDVKEAWRVSPYMRLLFGRSV